MAQTLSIDSPEARRFRLALDLYDAGEAMTIARWRREDPTRTEDDLRRLLGAWLADRPGADFGDTVGRPLPWPLPPRG